MKRLIYLVILPLSLLVLAGCGDDPPPAPKNTAEKAADSAPADGDLIVKGSYSDAANLLPVISSDSASTDINELVYSALIKIDKDLNIVGDLAESWDTTEDGRTITFHLRKGVKWHDGAPFTSADCLFTYQVMVDPKTPTPYAEQFRQIESAETPDDYTFIVKYKQTFARALITWGMPIVPKHLLDGRDIGASPLIQSPVGTGPYRFLEWETGQRVVLEANPDYFGGRPHIQRIVTRVVPEQSTMFLQLKNGDLDWMSLTPDQYERESGDETFKARYKKYQYLNFAYTYLGFNLLDERFQDVRVRRAIALAIDKQEIIDGVLLGHGVPANGPYKPGHWAYNPDVKPIPYDPHQATQLLEEAGWKDDNGDGVREKQGRPFEFTIMTNQGNQMRESTALIVQQRLKDVGIRVHIRIVEWAAFIKQFIDKKKFEAIVMGWTIPLDPDLVNVWHSSKTAEGELNFISYKNDEVDRLIDQGRFTLDREVRKKAYFRIQEILADEVPYVFLFVPDDLPCLAARIHGIQPAPAGIDHNITEWYVPRGLQKYEMTP